MSHDAFEEDEKKAKADEKRARQEEANARERWKHVLATPQGQAVIWEMLENFNCFGLSFHASGSIMNFNEGRRSAGNDLLGKWLDASPDTFFKTMKEKKGTKDA